MGITKHKSDKRKEYLFIVLYVLLFTFLIVLLCAGVYYASMSRYLKRQIAVSNAGYLEQLSSSYELFLENTIDSSMLFIENNAKNVMSLYQDEGEYKKQIYRHLESIAHMTGFIDSVYFFDKAAGIVYLSSGLSYEINDFYDGPWLDSLKESGKTWEILSARQLQAPLEGSKNVVPILIRYPFASVESSYFYVIHLKADALFKYLLHNDDIRKSYKVIDDNRNIFISGDTKDRFKSIDEFPYLAENMTLMEEEDKGYFITVNNGEKLFVNYVCSPAYDWIYLSELDYEQVFGQLKEPLLLIASVTALVLAVSFGLGILFSRRLYRPVRRLNELLKNTESLNDTILKKQFGYNLLARNYYSREDMERNLEKLHLNPNAAYVVCMFAVDDAERYLEEFKGQEQALWEYAFENVASEIAGEYGKSVFVGVASNKFALLFTLDREAEDEKLEETAKKVAEKVADTLSRFLHYSFSAGVGMASRGIYRVDKSFEQAREALRFLEETGSGAMTFRKMQTVSGKLQYSYENEENLLEIIKSGDGGKAAEFLQGMYEEFRQSNNMRRDGLSYFTFLMIAAVMKQGNELGLSREDIFGDAKTMTGLWESSVMRKDEQEALLQLQDTVRTMCDKIVSMREGVSNSQVRAITEFIREHYREPITLGDIAEHVGINQSTVSRLIKQHLKISTVDYINQLRIARAMELIEQGFGTVTEISNEAGFHNTHYFIRVFKKFTGRTPGNMIEELALLKKDR